LLHHDSTTTCTPLHLAVTNSHSKIVALLLSHPALDRTLKDQNGKTAQNIANEKGLDSIKDLFQPEKSGDLVQLLSLEEQLSQLIQKTKELELHHHLTQKQVTEMYKTLLELENEQAILKKKEAELTRQLQKKTAGSKQGLIDEFLLELEREMTKTIQLEEQLKLKFQPKPIDEGVINVYKNIQKVNALMKTVSQAFLLATNPLEKIANFLDVPEGTVVEPEIISEDTIMETKNSSDPPCAGFLII